MQSSSSTKLAELMAALPGGVALGVPKQQVPAPVVSEAVPAVSRFKVCQREVPQAAMRSLVMEGATPLMAKVLASRGLTQLSQVGSVGLKGLIHYSRLKGAKEAACILADRIEAKKKLLVIADYDCDGATACSVAVRGLRAFGADVQYLVPDRMIHGYGLTPAVVAWAIERFPDTDVIVTVDNGIASHPGVDAALAAGLEVVVTDHHLPNKTKPLPPAHAMVDPSQPECTFPSKALAGVGVIWYVMWALQDEYRARGWVPAKEGFKVSQLLPLVAIGTVADVVPLDENNRILIEAGLGMIRNAQTFPGIDALAKAGIGNKTNPRELITSDIAFGIGPRINAAGRLETMDIGIECLIADDADRAKALAEALNTINTERKTLEHATAMAAVEQAEAGLGTDGRTIAVASAEWHAGVIGIVAGRLKERRWRPAFVLAQDPETGELKGSGRSIPGMNLKDVLDQIDKVIPGLMPKFGGHAMAAGVTVRAGGFEDFKREFEAQSVHWMSDEALNQRVDHDGSLSGLELTVKTAMALRGAPWGQMFPEPSFCDYFTIKSAKVAGVNKDQLRLVVEREGVELSAIKFRHEGLLPQPGSKIRMVYKLQLDKGYYGSAELKLLIDHLL